jgi:trigger factor
MQVSMESVGALGRRLTVAVPAQRLEQAYAERLKRLARQVRLPGFRPGKVPSRILEQQYGPQLLEEAAGDVIQSSFREALGKEGLRPAGGPHIEPKSLKRGEELRYTAEFEVYPEIPAVTLKGARIERPRVEVKDEDVGRTLDTIRRQRTRYQAVQRAAQSGDRLVVDFSGRLKGEAFEGGTATDFAVVLGSQTLLPDLENGLVGAPPGELRSVAVNFPKDYRHPKLAGQVVDFDVRVKEVGEPVVPEIDEQLARELGVENGSVDDLRKQIRENLEREAVKRSEQTVRARVMKTLLSASRLEVPKVLIDEELQRMTPQGRQTPPAHDGQRRELAAKRVALGLLLAEAMRQLGVAADAGRVRAKLESMAQEYDAPQEFIQWHYSKPERLAEVEALVMEERIVEELLKAADMVDQAMGFQDLLKLDETL